MPDLDRLKTLARTWKDQEGLAAHELDELATGVLELSDLVSDWEKERQRFRHAADVGAQQIHELRGAVGALAVAAHEMLSASELGVPEEEGLRRAQRLATLIGYAFNPGERARHGLPDDATAAAREAHRLAGLLSAEVEVAGGGRNWAFALFLYREPKDGRPGDVIQVSRDRERTLLAVGRWLKNVLEAKDQAVQVGGKN